jgi:hypothetical protein
MWEYEIITLPPSDNQRLKLNAMGLERWECFGVTIHIAGATYYFKRPKDTGR